jgi:lipoate-protein ligase A
MERWFLLDDGPGPAAWNMAQDEFLLSIVERERAVAILRLYSFDPPAITIGYHQNPDQVLDMRTIERDRVDVVRRYTGGRALLHDDELTYCLVARREVPPFDSHLYDCYREISLALVLALRSLGVDAALSDGRAGQADRRLTRPCLDSTGRCEITAGARKIVASAQRRTRSALLQHGSIFLSSASGRIATYLCGEWPVIGDRLTGVAEVLGGEIALVSVKRAVVEAFERIFRISFMPLRPSSRDREEVERRARGKQTGRSAPRGGEVVL